MTKYFKQQWDRSRGSRNDSWGTATLYFEINEEGYPIKQIELYENGNRLKYHSRKMFDDYGRLGDQAINPNDIQVVAIEKEEFYREWQKSNPKKEHQEILDLLSDYLADHYSQRFGQAIFNLNINQFMNPQNPSNAPYRMRDIHNDSDQEILDRMKTALAHYKDQQKQREGK